MPLQHSSPAGMLASCGMLKLLVASATPSIANPEFAGLPPRDDNKLELNRESSQLAKIE